MIECEDSFILRLPLYPFSDSSNLSGDLIKELFKQPQLQEAILIASPIVYERLQRLLQNKLSHYESERLIQSLGKYVLRFCSRATPFGLFSGVSVGTWANETLISLSNTTKRHTRIDAEYARLLSERLLGQPEIVSKIRFYPNDTIYNVAGKLHYLDTNYSTNKREFYLSITDDDELLSTVLEMAKPGCDKFRLANSLVSFGVDDADALHYIEELIDNKLLISELEVRITGFDHFTHIRNVLRFHEIELALLDDIETHLRTMDKSCPELNLAAYPILTGKLKHLVEVSDYNSFLQVDSFRPATVNINRDVSKVIVKTTQILAGLMGKSGIKTMDDFKKKFFSRYEFNQVDLCTALDPTIGIGYPVMENAPLSESALLKTIEFQQHKDTYHSEKSKELQLFLLRKYSDALRFNSAVVLTEEELKPFLSPVTLPSSLYAFVSLYAESQNKIDAGDFQIHFSGAYGPSAATLIARFCHLDSKIEDMVRGFIRAESEQTEAVFAEIVHVNQARIANVSTRPVLREYEIDILSTPGVEPEFQITVNDLAIRIIGDRLTLWSKRLQKEVIPRLSSAHNYSHDTISVYRFLCDMQYEMGCSPIEWDWDILKDAPFLPRVRLGGVILCPARWKVSLEEVKLIKESDNLKNAITQLRQKIQLPEIVLVGEADTRLPINLENEDHHIIFKQLLSASSTLDEWIETACIKDDNQRGYINELIIPMKSSPKMISSSNALTTDDSIKRRFPVGSEWLYYKINCNTKGADQILIDLIKPLTQNLLETGVIDKWFYVRYADPQHHIRFRLHGHDAFYHNVIDKFDSMVEKIKRTNLIFNISIETYVRELERYGGENIVESEQLFFIDSQCCLDILTEMNEFDGQSWPVALLGIDQLLCSFGFSSIQKRNLMAEARELFFDEMQGTIELTKSIDAVKRVNRATIESAMNWKGLSDSIVLAMRKRGEAIDVVAKSILENATNGKLQVPVDGLIRSYIHMWINKLFQSNPRHHELVVLDFLSQYYESQLARQKNSPAN